MNKENSEDFEDFWKNVENIMKRRKMLGYQQFLVSLDHSEKQRKTPIGGGGEQEKIHDSLLSWHEVGVRTSVDKYCWRLSCRDTRLLMPAG